MKEFFITFFSNINSLAFWEDLFMQFYYLGPLVPIALTAIESLVPALPLIAIVVLNVAGHGLVLGMLYSWLGASVGSVIVFMFFRLIVQKYFLKLVLKHPKLSKARDWVTNVKPSVLFLLGCTPFAPSSFLNISFALSDYDTKTYLKTMIAAKFSMIAMMAIFGQSFVASFKNPWFILVAVALLGVMYYISKAIHKKHGLDIENEEVKNTHPYDENSEKEN